VPGLTACGAAAGVLTTAGALADGRRAAEAALSDLGRAAVAVDLPQAENGGARIRAFWEVTGGKGRAGSTSPTT